MPDRDEIHAKTIEDVRSTARTLNNLAVLIEAALAERDAARAEVERLKADLGKVMAAAIIDHGKDEEGGAQYSVSLPWPRGCTTWRWYRTREEAEAVWRREWLGEAKGELS